VTLPWWQARLAEGNGKAGAAVLGYSGGHQCAAAMASLCPALAATGAIPIMSSAMEQALLKFPSLRENPVK
jgi:hypothetical protein